MARKTYRATADGFLSAESRFIKEGETFSTDAIVSTEKKPCTWAEEVTDGEVRKQTKLEDKIVEAEKDKPDGSGPSADTMKLKQ